MQDYIIIANGDFLEEKIIHAAIQGRTIIALDGAINKLSKLGIKPNIILGDFDSINTAEQAYWGIKKTFADMHSEDRPYTGKHNVLIIPAKNQFYTDLTKAIHYCDTQKASSISIICALGGRMDHHEGAVRCLRREYKNDRRILIHAEQQSLLFAKNETIILQGKINDKCGVLGFPKGMLSTTGLQYDVENYELEFGFSDSICNSLKQPVATLQITGEALIIMPLQLKFMPACL